MIALMRRRSFLAAPLAAYPVAAYPLAAAEPDARVYAFGDGIRHTPAEYAKLLTTLANESLVVDDYSRGGVVEQLETRVAAMLGKEAAVWLPTGTLANHLAVRLLAGNRRRVLVQSESHLYNDCGDCAQTLSGLHLVPLAPGRATFTMEDVDRAAYDAAMGRVDTLIGAMQIETPVRRRQGERFDFEAMKKAAAWARAHNVGLHLDGARLFLESAYAGRPVKEYAALFDTVYVSLYKYFNADLRPVNQERCVPRTIPRRLCFQTACRSRCASPLTISPVISIETPPAMGSKDAASALPIAAAKPTASKNASEQPTRTRASITMTGVIRISFSYNGRYLLVSSAVERTVSGRNWKPAWR